MAKATNSFVTGKMNKDRDDRLLQATKLLVAFAIKF